ncbi:MAG: alpha/beta fold hydrolase [Myxococcota bacterium]
MHTHTLMTTDGIRLHAESKGTGPTMLLCNGLFCTTQYFVPWWNHFSQSHRLVQFDYRSHGASDDDPDPKNVTIERLVDDAALMLERLCPEQTIVVGHSMGVRVALELYYRYPHRIPTLLLLCGSAFDSMGPVPSFAPFRQAVLGTLRAADHAVPLAKLIKDVTVGQDLVSKVAYLLGGMSRTLTPREPVEALLANLDRLDVRMMTTLARSYIRHSGRAILPLVRVPTLFLVGEKDSLALPSHAWDVSRLMPDCEPYSVRGCTHLAPVERPAEVHRAAESFLERRGGAAVVEAARAAS